ncbi:Fanconi anemia core complex-associated protein 20 [Molossus molossus]|uniref:FA core complex associated protein 20 n=1 Tax=Molossus molossus TaxID=27622 RepID=A0A7J8B8M6_MOLMO|nr:Fanconi anemia core complex-associated protein 20 [Molossus molossus]KAF6394871.1 FA core complex associated protein 20 [Molossus molossus]
MEPAHRPRLRLSRRRPPFEGRPPSPGRGSSRDGDGECARLWAELLRAASADLSADGEPPPLPAAGQEPRHGPQRAASPEVFTVGSETFSWTPFPPALSGAEGPGRSCRGLRGAAGPPGSPARSPQGRTAPEPREVPTVQEQRAAGGAPTLQSCPMCQADFAPGLAQLDIDSHLAQCLAGSTEDVVW